MNQSYRLLNILQKILPSPFSLAILLTLITFLLALIFTQPTTVALAPHAWTILTYWQQGFWELLAFTMQMALILILGHTLAISLPIERLINKIIYYTKNTATSALVVSFLTISLSFLNWGMGLVFGAILARKIAENSLKKGIKIYYPLVGAAAYSGMMVWHGGLSGSAPLTVAGNDHNLINEIGQIGITETLLSPLNIYVTIALLLTIPLVFYVLGKNITRKYNIQLHNRTQLEEAEKAKFIGVEKLDHQKGLGIFIGSIMILLVIIKVSTKNTPDFLNQINLNLINFFLFGAGLIMHGSVNNFMNAVQKAITGATGILVQFPLYAGIMGIMKYSGLIIVITSFFIGISNEQTLPIVTFFSAGLVNIFVPSGGGQWIVQGPIMVKVAKTLGVSIPKIIMALAYGDQWTNMIQPFWALPLLGITQLKAKEIIPYSLIILLIGCLIFVSALIIF